MKHFVIISALVLLNFKYAICQNKQGWIALKLTNADSVLLVSHELTSGIKIMDKETGKVTPLPKLVIHNRPNKKIIHETKLIKGKYLDTLIHILERPFQDSVHSEGKCFMPHHAILVLKNGKTSYIDICFMCLRFEHSNDFQNIPSFDKRRWTELENFFKRQGIKYGFNFNDK